MDEHNLPRDGISREKEILDIKITKGKAKAKVLSHV